MGVIELYISTGKPIGSQTLKDSFFETMSSATIRNYFAELEEKGFLIQQHASGGRIPTTAAYRLYAKESLQNPKIDPKIEEKLTPFKNFEKRELSSYLHRSLDFFSKIVGYPVFLSSVRFDHDFIVDIKLVIIDQKRILCVLITDFGQIYTELLSAEKKISSFALKRIENYFILSVRSKQTGMTPALLSDEELHLAKRWYNEIMVRYLVRYSNFSDEEIMRTGFAELLSYPEFNDPVAIASALSLFENSTQMRLLLNDSAKSSTLRYWIGQDLSPYSSTASICSIIAVPYRINQVIVGSIGLLGPSRMPYPHLFGALQLFSEILTKALTTSLYKFKLTFREPRTPYLEKEERKITQRSGEALGIKSLIEIKE